MRVPICTKFGIFELARIVATQSMNDGCLEVSKR